MTVKIFLRLLEYMLRICKRLSPITHVGKTFFSGKIVFNSIIELPYQNSLVLIFIYFETESPYVALA